MRLQRLGAMHQSRLSFMRVLLRRLKQQNWRFDRPVWSIDERGVGVATYRAIGPERRYTLVAFAHDLPDELRSDRVIAEAWDATFALVDGDVSTADITRLSSEVPRQEAGRLSGHELVLSRANRSVRLFEHVIDCLAHGRQPEPEQVEAVGYLMRTTAVYGSGKFGAADRDMWAERPEFRGSFQPELLSVWLIRTFTLDLVEHLAKARHPETAVVLAPAVRRRFGVGNSTGLGMAPFLLNHPALLDRWIQARETALARVRELAVASAPAIELFHDRLARARISAEHWHTGHTRQIMRVQALRRDLQRLSEHIEHTPPTGPRPWDTLYRWGHEQLGIEAQEQLVSLLLEPYPELVDALADDMSTDESGAQGIEGQQSVETLRQQLEQQYAWALSIDFSQPAAIARVWYVSAEKLEPRLGERFEEPIEPYEQPLAPARDAAALYRTLSSWAPESTLAELLLQHPEHRQIVRRIQRVSELRYAEIRDNTIAADLLPIDLLRCKLSFFGATRFDPRSDRWIRITMYQGAPFPNELADSDPDDLAYPALPVDGWTPAAADPP